MKVSLVRLRRDGMRLRQAELDAPVVGHLLIKPMPSTKPRRPVMVANLVEYGYHGGVLRGLGFTLVDPVILNVERGSFSLGGIELGVQDKRTYEFAQVWRCEIVS